MHIVSHVEFATELHVKGKTRTIKILFTFLFMLLLWINTSERIPDTVTKLHLKGTVPDGDFLELVTEHGTLPKKLFVLC
jgi:hypothetical protein